MISAVTTSEVDVMTAPGQAREGRMCTLATVLAAIAIVSSAFHFWPFDSSKAWRMLCPPNLAVMIWILVVAGGRLLKPDRLTGTFSLPHLSVIGYLAVNVLSMAFAADQHRTAIFTLKLVLMLIGGYALLNSAIFSPRTLPRIYGLTTAAVMISVSYCLVIRFGLGAEAFGFHQSAYKYGTYVGTLAPLCGAYLLTSSKGFTKAVGISLLAAALISSGSLGAAAAIAVGTMVMLVIIPGWRRRLCIVGGLLGSISIMVLLYWSPATAAFRGDIKLAEQDDINLRQRYIEWQAQVNLLEERTIVGTGAGCINDYRSSYYGRLPKLNTLQAFDQNGWLTSAAESGMLGLACFCWIVLHYGNLALSGIRDTRQDTSGIARRFATANLVGLVAGGTANLFSSIYYNGVLIVFVLVLVLTVRTKLLFGEP